MNYSKQFITDKGYTVKEVAKILRRSENNVSAKLTEASITPEGFRNQTKGPKPKIWSGKTILKLIDTGIFGGKDGEDVWY